MTVLDLIKTDPESVKRYVADGHPPEHAQRFAAMELLEKAIKSGGYDGPFQTWLREVKNVRGFWLQNASGAVTSEAYNRITIDLWNEWQTVRNEFTVAQAAKKAAVQAAYEAEAAAEETARVAALRREAATNEAEQKRLARLVAHLQTAIIPSPELNPVNWQDLHKLKKHSLKAKHDVACRWHERFDALPDIVREAWMAYYGTVTVAAPGVVPTIDDDGDDSDGDDTPASTDIYPDALMVHVIPLPPGKREIDLGNADMVLAGVKHSAFRDFIPFNAGVRRLLDLIGNPIDDVILPAADPHAPKPAQELDEIADDDIIPDIVPDVIPRGLTIPHGDAKHCKSLWLQKLCLCVADRNGATFEGIEVEHGPVVYCTLDPSAEAKRVRPGIIEIRNRLGLKPSGRFHLTDVALKLNEPASVAHWIELNARGGRLPCKIIVVDSLFSAAIGSLAQDTVVQGCMEGVKALLRHCDAVIVPHHDNKEGDIFGSKFLIAMLASKIGMKRNVLKDGALGDQVKVRVEVLKFSDANPKWHYTLEGPYLNALGESGGKPAAPGGATSHPDMLARLPTNWTPIKGSRALVEDLFPADKAERAREKQWERLRKAWEDAKVIEVRDGRIRRVSR
jgi:hypothetical protein